MVTKVFYALIKGVGEGCDYTIACNVTYEKIEASSLEEAKAKLLRKWGEYIAASPRDDRAVDSVSIIEGIEHVIDCVQFRKQKEAEKQTAEYKAKEAKERAEYERLRLKYDPVSASEVTRPQRRSDTGGDGDCS